MAGPLPPPPLIIFFVAFLVWLILIVILCSDEKINDSPYKMFVYHYVFGSTIEIPLLKKKMLTFFQ